MLESNLKVTSISEMFESKRAYTTSADETANSLGRAVLYDSTGNGRGDSTLSGDYAAMLSRYGGAGGSSTGRVSRVDAVRLLMQGSFGPTRQSIARVRQMGVRGWIDDQISNRPATLHRDYIEEIFRDFDAHTSIMFAPEPISTREECEHGPGGTRN